MSDDSSDEENTGGIIEDGGITDGTAPYTVILDLANLETVKTKKGEYQLLNCDDHIGILRKTNRENLIQI